MTIEVTRATRADADELTACIDAAYAVYLDQGIQLPPVSEGVSDEIDTVMVWVHAQAALWSAVCLCR